VLAKESSGITLAEHIPKASVEKDQQSQRQGGPARRLDEEINEL
jgi:hypothetical protein